MFSVYVTVVLAAPAAAGATASACSIGNAQRVLDHAHLIRSGDEQGGVPPQGASVRRLACNDLTGDGRRDLLLTVGYPSSKLGVVHWIAFRRAGSGYQPMRFHDPSSLFRYAFRGGFRQGHKGYFMVAKGLSLSGRRGRITEWLRRYRDHDTDCCPSGGYMTSIWLWNGRSLVQG